MTKEQLLEETKIFLLDLDGTVYLDETPIGHAADTLKKLRAAGKQLVYLTNNSSRTEAQYREKLLRIGFFEAGDRVYTSGMATIAYLKENFAGKRVFLAGTEALKAEFRCAGIELSEDAPEVCVLAYDTELTYEKIRRFNAFLRDGVPFLATHPDDVCPAKGHPVPDVGSFLALFAQSAGRRPDVVIGKPNRPMGIGIERMTGVPCGQMCMVGDRMHTDIRFANNNGMKSILVLSGETTRETLGKFPDRPDLILGTIDELF